MTDILLETIDLMFLLSLNPVAWAIVIIVAIRKPILWKSAIFGTAAQLISIVILLSFIIVGYGIDVSELLQDVSTGAVIVQLIIVSATSGLMMSILVVLFVKQRRLRELA